MPVKNFLRFGYRRFNRRAAQSHSLEFSSVTSLISVVKQLPVRLGLFADENKDPRSQRQNVEKENGRAQIQAEP